MSEAPRIGADPSLSLVLAMRQPKPAPCSSISQFETFFPGGKQEAQEKSQERKLRKSPRPKISETHKTQEALLCSDGSSEPSPGTGTLFGGTVCKRDSEPRGYGFS